MTDVTPTDSQPVPETETPVLTMTSVALAKIQGLLTEHTEADYMLRVFVQGGGCSGLSYGMGLDDKQYDGDCIVEHDGVRLVVDINSLPYLRGSEIDYVDGVMGSGFAINNPNAVSSCGCGQSFRADDDSPDAGCGSGCNCH